MSSDASTPPGGTPRPARRRLRSLRRVFWKSLAVIIIGSAALVSLGRLLAPYADQARPLVEGLLSDALEQPVRIREIQARWPRMSPEITLLGLEIGPAEDPLLQFDQARLQFRLYNLARPARNTMGLAVLGLDASLVQAADGRWSWQLEQGARLQRGWERTLTAGDLTLRDVGIRIVPQGLPPLRLRVPEAALTRDGSLIAARLLARPGAAVGDPVEIGLRMDLPDSRLAAIRGHAEIPRLAFVAGPGSGQTVVVSGQLWLNWRAEDGLDGRVQLGLVRSAGEPDTARATLDAVIRGQGASLRVGLDARDPERGSTWMQNAAFGYDGRDFAFGVDRLDLAELHDWVAPWRARGVPWPALLEGEALALEFGVSADGWPFAARGSIEGPRVVLDPPVLDAAVGRLDLGLAGDALRVRPTGPLRLDWPALMPETVVFDRTEGAVELRRGQVGFDGLTVADEARTLRVDGEVRMPGDEEGRGPFLDLVVDTPQLASREPERWLPLRGLPPKTRAWLARGLISVGRVEALTTLFGDPTGWKQHLPDGALNSRIRFAELELDYAPGWPRAEAVGGELEFLGDSLVGSASAGRVAGTELRAPLFRIAELRKAEIELQVESAPSVNAAGLAALTRALPLPGGRDALARTAWEGGASASASIWLPVKHIRDWRMNGRVAFDEAGLDWSEPDYRLDAIRGEIGFNRAGFGPAELEAERAGARLPIEVAADFTPAFELRLAGRWPLAAALPDDRPMLLEPWLADVSGAARFEARIGRSDDRPTEVRVRSDLVGMALDLPAPLAKSAELAWPLDVTVPTGDFAGPIRIDLVDRVEVAWSRGDPLRFGVGLGPGRASVPEDRTFQVQGALSEFDLGGWSGRLAGRVPTDREGTPSRWPAAALDGRLDGLVDLRIERARLGRSDLGLLAVALEREADYWRLALEGPNVSGRIRLPGRGGGTPAVIAEFERLHWPRGPSTDEPPGRPSALDPRRLPELDVRIDDLRFGDLELGRLTMNSHASADGLEIEQFATEHPVIALTGSGGWRADADAATPGTRGRFRLTADSLGQVLADAGFDLALQRGQAVITLDGGWPGSPLDFTLQRFDGELDLAIGDGVIPEARPGAGRLLGLVSLNSIPRRLRLDFTDVFAEGLTFDRVAGHFELAAGRASTDDLVIEAPAAVVQVRGETDLVERTYDQRLVVQPGVGSTLPIIGALTGGPVGAAAGAALQQLLDRPLRGISEVQYAVTGTWNDPQIVPVSARGVETLPDDPGGEPPGA